MSSERKIVEEMKAVQSILDSILYCGLERFGDDFDKAIHYLENAKLQIRTAIEKVG